MTIQGWRLQTPMCGRCSRPRLDSRCPFGRNRLGNQRSREASVADVAAAVTDTHALMFHAAGGGRLGHKAAAHFQACEQRQALTYVPAAVVWEVTLLTRAGRV